MTVEVEISSHDFDPNPSLIDIIEKKVGRLDHYLPSITEARVDLTVERSLRNAQDRKVAQLTVRSPGAILRAEERTADMLTSVEAVIDKIQRQIERYKAKHYHGRGNGSSAAEMPEVLEELPGEPDEDPEEQPAIVRRKRHLLAPMNEAEAIEQMQLIGHDDFFVFYNAETNAVNVLYRRQNETLGLIETEIG